jgi:outer membrane receptor protein involved in Fe transport
VNTTYEATAWLSFNYRLGIDYYVTDGKEVYELGAGETNGRPNDPTDLPTGGRITDFSFTNNQVNSNVHATLNRDLTETIHLHLVLGNELYDMRSRQLSNIGRGLNTGGFRNIADAASQTTSETISRRRVVGFYSSLTASWKDMVYLHATGRQDYVSNMPRGNRSFFYPSVGLGLVFTELLPAGQQVLSFGKLRGSYAQVGATGPLYPSRDVFIPGGSHSVFLQDGIRFPFNGLVGYSFSDIKRNPALKPQNTKTYEFGGEFRFLNDRIGVDYTYFYTNVTDQIFEVPMAPATGLLSELRNAGELTTTGNELTLNITPVRARAFSWDITTNFTQYENKVKRLAPGVQNIYLGGYVLPNVRAQAGQTFPVIFGSRYLRDEAGNIVHNQNGMPLRDPIAGVIGQVQPDFEFGFINTLSFKGLTLAAQLDWRQGGQMYSGNTMLGRFYGIQEETEDREREVILPGVKIVTGPSGQVTYAPNDILIKRDDYFYALLSNLDEAHVFNTTFVRLREATLAFELPKALIERTRAFTAAVITFTGRNLFLITDYPDFDPETSVGGASNFQGIEFVSLPQSRSFGAGIRLTF